MYFLGEYKYIRNTVPWKCEVNGNELSMKNYFKNFVIYDAYKFQIFWNRFVFALKIRFFCLHREK